MTSAILAPIHQIEITPGSAICIGGIDWDEYLTLLQQLGEARSTRIAYNDSILEIRMPGQLHESINRVLAAIVMTLAEEFGYEFNGLGSTTLNRPLLGKAIEPDSCFYIQNARGGQGLTGSIDNNIPPDLAIIVPIGYASEVDIASRSDGKFTIYREIGVPEIWVYQSGGAIVIKQLADGEYLDVDRSLAFPAVTTAQLSQWIEVRRTGTDLTVIRAVRTFCSGLGFRD
jgi:Uma2 family endonuclease